MCTAITYTTNDFYFGRTLDYEHSFGETVTFTPRCFPLPFRHKDTLTAHYAILGMARVEQGHPLYFDGFNEYGLAMAGLNFVGNASYGKPQKNRDNIAQFELIPWILGQCASVKEAKALLDRIQITDTAFSPELPPAQLHWIIADRNNSITVEAMADELKIYDNPVGVLTNNPPFDRQLFHLNQFMHLSPKPPVNRFCPELPLEVYSRGMGALGLPGDLSSQSRFVRAAFVKLNSKSAPEEMESVGQCFHILDTVAQVRGCCDLGDGQYEATLYAACCNASQGIYYYTTYENRSICAVSLRQEDLDAAQVKTFPLHRAQNICFQN